MKKVMFIIRDGFDAAFLCSELKYDKSRYQVFYVIESGSIARKKKAKRMLKSRKNMLSIVANMCSIFLYDRIMIGKMTKICGRHRYPDGENYYYIDDVNEKKCLEFSNRILPDLIMIYGSGILKKQTIEKLKADIYNIHSSVLPYYRNVHSDFWAFMNKDFSKIGITIFRLTAGIDTGSIALQKVCSLPAGSCLEEYKVQNLYDIVCLVQEFWDKYFQDKIVLKKQDEDLSTIANTPSTLDIVQFFIQKRNKLI